MYETHFGFHRQPFHSADASRAFFVSESIRTILPQLLHALRSDLGIAVLTGVPGSGKTSLLRHIQQQLSNEGRVIVCSGASLGATVDLIGVLWQASRMKAGSENTTKSHDADSVLPATRSYVMEHMKRTAELWGPILLLIDDAQLVPLPVLNELRACTEEEWNGRDLVRCLVSAPISFEEQLARSEYAEFGRRIRCHAFLQPLRSVESVRFLRAQIELAGGRLSQVLTTPAVELIATAADGIPRCLSLLADETLVVAAECGEKTATEQSVRAALSRLQHLQYNWNASPLADISESPLSDVEIAAEQSIGQVASSIVRASVTATVSRPTSARAALSPGVIEFGGPSMNAADVRRATESPARTITAARSNVAEPFIEVAGHDVDSGASPVSFATPPSVFEFGVTQSFADVATCERVAIRNADSALFEVGRRFFAESSEDSISIEDCNDSEIVNLMKPSDELDHQLWDSMTSPEPAEYNGESPASESALRSPPPTDERIFSASCRASNSGFIDLGDSRMSNRTPVFDRYTWLALGREVPPGTGSYVSQTKAKQLLLADCGMLATNQLAMLCLQTPSRPQTASMNQIPITHTTDSMLIEEISHRWASRDSGSFELFSNMLRADSSESQSHPEINANAEALTGNEAAAFPGLKIWRDGQLLFAQSGHGDSSDAAEAVDQHTETIDDAVNEPVRGQPEPLPMLGKDGFFTLPVPSPKGDWDLQSPEISGDHDVFPILESVTSLRAAVRQFQQTGRIAGSDASGTERVFSPDTELMPDADTLISRAIRRLDDRTAATDSAIVALQMAPDARAKRAAAAESEVAILATSDPGSGPQFSRLFTRLWENRRRAAGQIDVDR